MAFNSEAQSEQQKYWVTISLDNNQYGSIINSPFDDLLSLDAFSFSLGVERYLNKSFNVSAMVSLGKVSDMGADRANVFAFQILPKYKLANGKLLKEDFFIKPFVGIGLGFLNYSEAIDPSEEGTSFGFSPTVGIEYYINDRVKLYASTAYRVGGNINDNINFRQYSIGVGFSLSKKTDSDKDGTPDHKDKCPDEVGAPDNEGCPYIDEPTEQPQPADSLKTGRPELEKTEETKPEEVKPATSIKTDTVQVKPDPPLKPEGMLKGDSTQNRTPAQRLEELNQAKDTGPLYVLPLEKVRFSPGTDRISRQDLPKLDELAQLMADDESFKLELNGYGDQGRDGAVNFELARKRALAVKNYLISKGRSPYRFITNVLGTPRDAGTNGVVVIKLIAN